LHIYPLKKKNPLLKRSGFQKSCHLIIF